MRTLHIGGIHQIKYDLSNQGNVVSYPRVFLNVEEWISGSVEDEVSDLIANVEFSKNPVM
jgi:hypothetical protein